MEDIIAVKIRRANFPSAYILTWGRIQSSVDPDPVLAVIKSALGQFGIDDDVELALCPINEASGQPYFFEAFFGMCQKAIPYGDAYQSWQSEMAIRMAEGRDMYLLSDVH